MIRLELTTGEAETLREVCEDTLSDLRMEIGGTDKMEYREALKAKEALLKRLIERLAAAPA
jgi:hypothetical protein